MVNKGFINIYAVFAVTHNARNKAFPSKYLHCA